MGGSGLRVKLVSYTVDGERLVAAAAKQTITRKPVDPQSLSDEEVETWIRETYRRQHWSPWEFSQYTFLVDGCSRVCSHQLVRHRHASYAQLSQRYSEGYLRRMALEACEALDIECPRKPKSRDDYRLYSEVLNMYWKDYTLSAKLSSSPGRAELEPLVELAEIGYVIPRHVSDKVKAELAQKYIMATAEYYKLLSLGVAKEDARFILPQAIRTMIYVSMNARELVTVFLPLRMCTRAQWEIRELAWRMWGELVRVHPHLFRYAGPRCVFQENAVRGGPVELRRFLSGEENFTIPRCPDLVPREGIRNCLAHAARSAGVAVEINTIGDESG